MFWSNLRGVMSNLPLTLSDSYDPKDLSLNRIITALMVVNALGLMWYMVLHPEVIDRLMGLWERLLAFLGAQVTVVNMIKRGIDAFRDIKGGNQGAQSNPAGHPDNG